MSTRLGTGGRLTRFLLIVATVFAMTATTTLNNVARAQDVTPTVILMSHPTYGMILTDSAGFTLYTWQADEPWLSNCWDSCADAWPPLLAWTDLIAPMDLPFSLDLFDRGDGTWQVALDGWPLYYFVRDMQPGDVTGDGSMGFGARWDVIALAPPAPIAVDPMPAPPVAQPPVAPAPPVAQPAPAIPDPPAAAIPAPPIDMMPPMGMPPIDLSQIPMGLPPGLLPGQAVIPPGYVPTVTVVVPPNGTIGLSWMPTPSAQSYRIYQTLSSQPLNYTVVQTVQQTPGQLSMNAIVAGLQPGNSYFFQVRAVDPSGNEALAPATAMVGPAPNAALPGPGVGTTLLMVGSTTPTSIALSWTPLPGARSYVVLQATSPTGPFVPAQMSQSTLSGATIVGLSPNTMYYFQLLAIDALGNQSPASGAVSLTTAPVAAATSTGITVSNITSSTANLSWAAVPNAISYQVLQAFSANGPWAIAAIGNPAPNGGQVTGLQPGATYYFAVIALDAMGNQVGATIPVTASTLASSSPLGTTMLAAPSSLVTSSTTGSSVTLSWTASPGATNYSILQGMNGSGPFTPASVTSVSGTSATISGLNPNSTYFFQVVAMDGMGHQSGPSNMTTAQTTSSIANTR